MFFFPFVQSLGMELLDHEVVLCLTLLRDCHMDISLYIPASDVRISFALNPCQHLFSIAGF